MRVCTALLMLYAAMAVAQEKTPPPEMTAADVATFFDGLVPAERERADVAGLVIAVVKGGRLLFSKGYGYSDIVTKKPVSPDATLFRPGSISKLFTWTAVMQLVEQGKLDLDRDVNEYLDFRIPPTYSKPITLRNIMTHTSGFEETVKELFVSSERELKPLGQYLKEHLPARIFSPGTTPAYSNYATSMAGYIVERISGQPFEQYVSEHLLVPLRLTHTTFSQPLPAHLKPLMSSGYQFASQSAKPFEFVEAFPAGSVSTSALDMTRFMLAHLRDGEWEGARILRPETARLMHSRQFGLHSSLNGMCLGFYEEARNGHRIIGHGGDTGWFHSDLHLMADQDLGFFISQNSAGKNGPLRGIIWQKFLDRYYPYDVPPDKPISSAAADARAVAGYYEPSRGFRTTIAKLTLMGGEAKISVNRDGTISMSGNVDYGGAPKHFQEIAPLLFRDTNGQDEIAFHRDDSGRMVAAVGFPAIAFQAVQWRDHQVLNFVLIGVSLGILGLTLFLWPMAAGTRWHFGRPLKVSPATRRVRIGARAVCVLDFAFAVLVARLTRVNDPAGVNALDPWIRSCQMAGLIGAVGTLLVLFSAWRTSKEPEAWWWTKLHEVALVTACTLYVWFELNWNLFNFNLHF
jgi:CubicO group peptidase (beta-lactamase class C family)